MCSLFLVMPTPDRIDRISKLNVCKICISLHNVKEKNVLNVTRLIMCCFIYNLERLKTIITSPKNFPKITVNHNK